MRENPVPTRSEVMDVYSAVLSGVDGLMVTAETAIGYPVECVRWISRIITRAEEELTTPKREKGKNSLRKVFIWSSHFSREFRS